MGNKKSIMDFMTEQQKLAYTLAHSLSVAREKDRGAWSAAVLAAIDAETLAIAQYKGGVIYNKRGQIFGGIHPALVGLEYLDIGGCYAPE
jgi:hypothetical protein